MATELENLVPEVDVEVEGMRGPKGDKGDSYILTEADKEEIAQKVDKIIDADLNIWKEYPFAEYTTGERIIITEEGLGTFVKDGNYARTGLIPCKPGKQYYSGLTRNITRNVFYDSSRQPLNSFGVFYQREYFDIPEDAAYFALSGGISNMLGLRLISQFTSDTKEVIKTLANDVTNAEQTILEIWTSVNACRDAIGTVIVELKGGYNNQYWNSQNTSASRMDISSTYTSFDPISVNPGTIYHIYAFQGTSTKQNTLLFVDSNYTILSRYGERISGYLEADVTAPENATYALITVGTRSQNVVNSTSFGIYELSGNTLKNKVVAIIGDSISTNGDYAVGNEYGNVPEIIIQPEDVGVQLSAYVTYYDIGTTIGGHEIISEDVGTELVFTPLTEDVGKIVGKPLTYNPATKKVWWEVAMEKLEFIPIPVCWSGSSITSHEGNEDAYKTSYAWHDAQIRKCGVRMPGTMMRTAPDVIIIYRGTNDFSHSPYAKLTSGYFDSLAWQYPTTDSVVDGYGYKEGLCLTIKKLRDAYPNTQIILCTLNIFKRVSYNNFPTRNGYNTLPEYNSAIREVADYMGCNVIDFDKDGITFENCYSGGYITDSATTPTHPSDKGHTVMGAKAVASIKSFYSPLT